MYSYIFYQTHSIGALRSSELLGGKNYRTAGVAYTLYERADFQDSINAARPLVERPPESSNGEPSCMIITGAHFLSPKPVCWGSKKSQISCKFQRELIN